MWAADNIVSANMLFNSLYYDILNLTSLKITQAFHLLLGFAENQTVLWDFKIQNSVQITEGSDKIIEVLLYIQKDCIDVQRNICR